NESVDEFWLRLSIEIISRGIVLSLNWASSLIPSTINCTIFSTPFFLWLFWPGISAEILVTEFDTSGIFLEVKHPMSNS
ncbi:7785_t:CDS:1, partial [Funneliformis mosseae]